MGSFRAWREPNITADAHDMDAFVKEMDDNGIVKAVLMAAMPTISASWTTTNYMS